MPDQSFRIDIGGPGIEDDGFRPIEPEDDFRPIEPDFNYSDFSTGGMPDYGGGYAPEPDYSQEYPGYEPPQYGAPKQWEPEPYRAPSQDVFGADYGPQFNTPENPQSWWDYIANEEMFKWPREKGKEVSDYLTQTTPDQAFQSINDYVPGLGTAAAMNRGFYTSMPESAGGLVSGLSTRLNLATLPFGVVGGAPKIATVAPNLARIARVGEAALSAPVVAHGGYEMLRPDATWSERGRGAFEAAMGMIGVKQGLQRVPEPHVPPPAKSQIPLPNAEPFVPRGQLSFTDPTGAPGPALGAVEPYAPSPQPSPIPPIIPPKVSRETKYVRVPTPSVIAQLERHGWKRGKWHSMEEGGGLTMYREKVEWPAQPPAPPPTAPPPPTPPPPVEAQQGLPGIPQRPVANVDYPKPLPGESLMRFQRRTQLPIDEARVYYEAAKNQAAPIPAPAPVVPPPQPTPVPSAPVPVTQAAPRQLPERFTPRPGETFNQFQTRNRLRTSAARELWDAAKKPVPELPESWQGMTGTETPTGVGDMISESRRARALGRLRDEAGRFLKEDKGEWELGAATSNLLKIMRGEATDTPLGRILGQELPFDPRLGGRPPVKPPSEPIDLVRKQDGQVIKTFENKDEMRAYIEANDGPDSYKNSLVEFRPHGETPSTPPKVKVLRKIPGREGPPVQIAVFKNQTEADAYVNSRGWNEKQQLSTREVGPPKQQNLPRLLRPASFWEKRDKAFEGLGGWARKAIASIEASGATPSDAIGRRYGKSLLMEQPKGPPGLTVQYDPNVSSTRRITFRDSEGNPIGHATVFDTNGELTVPSLAVDEKSGAQGEAILAITQELAKLGANLPNGSFSEFTWNMLKRLAREDTGTWEPGKATKNALAIVQRFRKGLKVADNPRQARFILPDGTALTHSEKTPLWGESHSATARDVGTNVEAALNSGIIRFTSDGSAHIGAPITRQQAEFLADSKMMAGRDSPLYMDVEVQGKEGKHFKSVMFDERTMKPDTIFNKVNIIFKNFMTDETGAIDARDQLMWPVRAAEAAVKAAQISKNYLRENAGWGRGNAARRTPVIEGEIGSTILHEAIGLPKNAMTIGDYSGVGKQTYPTIYSKHFWTGIWPMIKGGWDEKIFHELDASYRQMEAFKRPVDQAGNVGKSLADRAGLRLHEWGSDLSKRGEQVASNWIENGAFLGPYEVKGYRNLVREGYNQTLGRVARGSNRSFMLIRNHVAANMFQDLVDSSRNMAILGEETGRIPGHIWKEGRGFFGRNVTPEQAADLNPYLNDAYARDIADAVRTMVGDPPLRTHVLPHPAWETQGRFDLEKAADVLSAIFFAPRLAMRQVRMLNPSTYIMAPPAVRKEYMKSLLSMTAAWGTVMKGLSMAGVSVEWDMTSSDFGKGRIGNTRFGPSTEFLPYLVLGARLWEGGYTQAAEVPGGKGQWHEFGKGFGAATFEEMTEGLAVNKLEPVVKFVHDLANASDYRPFHVIDRTLGLFTAMTAQDLVALSRESPGLAGVLALPIVFGFGTQTYSRHDVSGKIIPAEHDWVIKGGGVKHRLKDMGFPVETRQ